MEDLVRGVHAGFPLVASTMAAYLSGVPLVFSNLGPSVVVLVAAHEATRGTFQRAPWPRSRRDGRRGASLD